MKHADGTECTDPSGRNCERVVDTELLEECRAWLLAYQQALMPSEEVVRLIARLDERLEAK